MTSSLVGSEMCIRDRSYSKEKGLPSVPSIKRPVARYHLREGRADKFGTCLLYTSDAADDM
eukprot:1857599-Prorocentrum_lima.AAC.1